MLPPEIVSKLTDPTAWFSMSIKDRPNIDRLWLKSGESRLCLHRLYPLQPGQEPYFHKHPWACETRLLYGSYWMNVGYGAGPTPPPVAARLRLTAGSVFVMDKAESWHTVEPDGMVYSVFQITTRWDGQGEGTCRTRHNRLASGKIEELLADFSAILRTGHPLSPSSLANLRPSSRECTSQTSLSAPASSNTMH